MLWFFLQNKRKIPYYFQKFRWYDWYIRNRKTWKSFFLIENNENFFCEIFEYLLIRFFAFLLKYFFIFSNKNHLEKSYLCLIIYNRYKTNFILFQIAFFFIKQYYLYYFSYNLFRHFSIIITWKFRNSIIFEFLM